MKCLQILEKSGGYEITDRSGSCPKCGAKTKEIDECSLLGKKYRCKKCDQTFIKEIHIDCKYKKIEIRLKNT